MIVYGYIIDRDKNWNLDFDDLDLPEGVVFYGGYSVGGYDPEMATLGITLAGRDFLFNPTALNSLNTEPTAEQIETMENFEIPEEYKEIVISSAPEVLIYDPTDD